MNVGSWGTLIYPNASENVNGLPIFGLSAMNGMPAKLGIYSVANHASNYPVVLNYENVIDNNRTTIIIGAIKNVNRDSGGGLGIGYIYPTVFYTWKNPTTGHTGVAVSSVNRKNEAYWETRMIPFSRANEKHGQIIVPFRRIPAGTYVAMYISANYQGYEQVELEQDDERMVLQSSTRAVPS